MTSSSVPRPTVFAAGPSGPWSVERLVPVRGEGLAGAQRLAVARTSIPDATWSVRGVAGHARYATAAEQADLGGRAAPLGRHDATLAAMILVRKDERWWSLAQDERRAILEERSKHVSTGARYVDVIARRLFHARDLGEPFDFVTWFEFPPAAADAFDALVAALRATEEWAYVDREVDVRLARDDADAPVPGA